MTRFEVGEIAILAFAYHPALQPYIGQEVVIEEVGPVEAINVDGSKTVADYIIGGINLGKDFALDCTGFDPVLESIGVRWFQLHKKPISHEPESITRSTEVPETV